MSGKRLDVFVKERYGLSRDTAGVLIRSGGVSADGKTVIKPSYLINEGQLITVRPESLPRYVSRGGVKLAQALARFRIDISGKRCLDIGASTGGFTDCMLQNGAKRVIAVDVGTDQLARCLREDERVVSLENTNVTALDPHSIPQSEFCGVDVSFVSLTKILPYVKPLLTGDAALVALVKPQFEAGRQRVSKRGLVKDAKTHESVLRDILSFVKEAGFCAKGLIPSPIRGGSGNIEYLLYLDVYTPLDEMLPQPIPAVVEEAFETFKKTDKRESCER